MTKPPWTPEHPVDAALCLQLVRTQFPDLGEVRPEALGSGWCNDVWRLGEVAWRFPRKAAAVPPLEREVAFLPALAPRLAIAIPVPEWVGTPGPDFPAPFYGHRFLEGTPADRRGLTAVERGRLASQLGRFLGDLHRIPVAVAEAWGLPDGARRCDLARRVRLAHGHLDELGPILGGAGVDALGRGLTEALASPAATARVPLHGDVYARHLLLDAAGDLAGVIDWEDACLGDPAADLSVAATMLPEAGRSAFWSAYRRAVDGPTWMRALGFGWTYVAFLGAYAVAQRDEALAAEVRAWITNLGGVSR